MRRSAALALCLIVATTACAPKARVVVPDLVGPNARLAAADSLVTAGCLDCLIDAYRTYDALSTNAAVRFRATAGAVRSAVLIAIRENELGLLDSGALQRARQHVVAAPDMSTMVEIAEALAAGPAGQTPFATTDSQTRALVTQSTNQARWITFLRARMPDDPAATYLWLSLACGVYASQVPGAADRLVVVGPALRTPLIAYKEVTACTRGRAELLQPVLDAEPRFREGHFFVGLAALSGQSRPGAVSGAPDVDAADLEFRAAYEWRQDWPSLTLLIANTALTAEDFNRALEFYDKTLAMMNGHPDALLGKIRALSYLQRYGGAIAAADALLATGRNPGEARYWRALNEEQFARNEEAWVDVEIANELLKNADATKLAGIIAIGRGDLAVARQRLELSLMRRPIDCETGHYLEIVLSEQREWERAIQAAQATASCFDGEETILRAQLESLRSSTTMPVERRDRQIIRRERQIATNARMRATAWFNSAAAYFNLGKKEEAKGFAERLTTDEQFGSRARDLIALISGRR